jgi:hypothetical protein
MRADAESVRPLEGVQNADVATRVQYSAIIPGPEENTQGDPTSGVLGPIAGDVCYKQITCDVSDFLGSCVRLCKELTNAQDVPLKPALAPFVDETGNDYGLGAGMCEEAPDGLVAKDAYVDVEKALQELARNAGVGVERDGYFV